MELGSRIRKLRVAANLSQDELAKKVYVVRQTISNWETNKTLPDLESLKLLADAFGVSADELLGSERQRAIDEFAEQRQQVVRSLLIYAACYAVQVMLCFVSVVVIANHGPDMWLAFDTFELVVSLAMLRFWWRAYRNLKAIKSEHDLRSMRDIAMFAQGFEPGDKLPDDFLYRVILPNWTVFSMCVIGLLMLTALVIYAGSL